MSAPNPARSRDAVAGLAGGVCVVAPALVAVGAPSVLRFAAVLALLALAPGAALLAFLLPRTRPFELGLVAATGLAVSTLTAQAMLSLGAWAPEAFLYLLAAACLATLVTARARGRLGRGEGDAPADASTSRFLSGLRMPPLDVAAHLAVIAVALVLWIVSVRRVDLAQMAGLGLLDVLPAPYFVAFVLLMLGFAAAVAREPLPQPVLWLYVLALIALVHATAPLLYDQPRYAWTYKHIGVIGLIASTGATDRTVDIYNNWPGFFALNAWLRSVTGVSPLAYAEWAQAAFNLANVLALRFALRGVTTRERIVWSACWFLLLGNWLGGDYLAPQALGFFLGIVVLGLALRCAPPGRALPPSSTSPLARWYRAGVAAVSEGPLRRSSPGVPSLPPKAALLVGALCFTAVVVSHQISPMMLIAGVLALAVVVRRVPLWVPALMGAIEGAWLLLARPFLRDNYDLFAFEPLARPSVGAVDPLPGVELHALAVRGIAAAFLVLAIAGWLRRRRGGMWDLAPAVLVLAPVPVSFVQPYGGEASFRAYLFALPWLAFFAASACASARRSQLPALLRSWRLSLSACAVGALLLVAAFGLELMNRIDRFDVAASVWYDTHAPPGSVLLYVAPNFPNRVTARYARLTVPGGSFSPNLTDEPAFRGHRLGARDLPAVANLLRSVEAPAYFIVVSPSQERFTRLYGLVPDGSFESIVEAFNASPAFAKVYEFGPASIFEFDPRVPTRPTAKSSRTARRAGAEPGARG